MLKDDSPFTPGIPVGLELFVGRTQQIRDVSRRIRQAASSKQQNVFLIGDRGVGKSSFASAMRRGASGNQGMVGIHVFLSRLTTEERDVFDNLRRRLQDLGVTEQDIEQGRGAYRFTDQLYPVYLYMESQRY